ncbi:RF-1 domain-containing protein [Aspergillus coremiiformis]|uniref:RF-1 domain-containing protein n=1 Tax=Aspergillus coremiiformis TaxID=138285 RepID=A0A5N6ZDG1_9EURO|nr:RF-1 domain-containing protein [Aspergillus coremiiformis]
MLLRTLIPRNFASHSQPVALLRCFTITSHLTEKPLPPRLKINDADLTVSYLKGSGPGGQKINKTSSAVQLIHKPTGLVVKSQATRSRSQNEKIARQLLADKIEHLEKGEQSRTAIKADRARKKKASKMKKSRRKYRNLEEGRKEPQEQEPCDEKAYQEPVGEESPKAVLESPVEWKR